MSPRIVYWSSKTGNCHSFVTRLGQPAIRLPNSGEMPQVEDDFVLITPTFADGEGRGAVPKPVIHFLNNPENRKHLRGVIGSGNRNFGALFGIGARTVSEKCQVPMLYRFELSGTERDLAQIGRCLELLFPQDVALRHAVTQESHAP